MDIRFTVTNQNIEAVKETTAIGTVNYINCLFDFTTEDWDGTSKYACFQSESDETIYTVPLVDNACHASSNPLMETGNILMSVVGVISHTDSSGTEPVEVIDYRITSHKLKIVKQKDTLYIGEASAVMTADEIEAAITQIAALADLAKSYAKGGTSTRTGEDTDNAKYYKEQAESAQSAAAGSATSAGASALISEGYAKGSQNGTDVESGTYYHDNAKYYKEQANALGQEQAQNAEAWARGTKGGVDVPSTAPQYQDNAKYYKEQASSSATTASNQATAASGSANAADGSAKDSEAYAVGKRGGVDVTSGDAAYQNNSKYYAAQASGSATTATLKAAAASDSAAAASGSASAAASSKSNAEAYADGTRDGDAVGSDDPTYHNNAKYWKEQADSSASAASGSASGASASALVAEGYAKGSQNGTDVSEGTYFHDNAKYYKEQAAASATSASGSASTATTKATLAQSYATGDTSSRTGEATDNAKYYKEQAGADASSANTNALKAEGYAVGKQGGEDVESGTYYHDNSKYYKEQAAASATAAAGSAEDAEAYANGTRDGADVSSDDPAYENNAKYWKEQTEDIADTIGAYVFVGSDGNLYYHKED